MAGGNKHLLSADVISLARGKKRPPVLWRGGRNARDCGRMIRYSDRAMLAVKRNRRDRFAKHAKH